MINTGVLGSSLIASRLVGSSNHLACPHDFKRGDLVWAKVRGYSWWPANIGDVIKVAKERKYRVDFIGDNTH